MKANLFQPFSLFNLLTKSIRTLKNEIYKYMTSISKDEYIYLMIQWMSTIICMRPVDVKSVLFINFDVENNNKDPKLEAGDLVIMSKYKVIFAEGYFSS